MYCRKCGTQLNNSNVFCPKCGEKVEENQKSAAMGNETVQQTASAQTAAVKMNTGSDTNSSVQNEPKAANASIYPKHAHDYGGLLNMILLLINIAYIVVFIFSPLFKVSYNGSVDSVSTMNFFINMIKSYSNFSEYLSSGTSEQVAGIIGAIVYAFAYYIPIIFILEDLLSMKSGQLNRKAMTGYVWMMVLLVLTWVVQLVMRDTLQSVWDSLGGLTMNFGSAFELFIFLSIIGIVVITVVKSLAKNNSEILYFGKRPKVQQPIIDDAYRYGNVEPTFMDPKNASNSKNQKQEDPSQTPATEPEQKVQSEEDAYKGTIGMDEVAEEANRQSGTSRKIFLIGEKMTLEINRFPAVIGRNKNLAAYVLDDSTVSKVHCEIAEYNGNFYVKDLGSSNGTCVNGKAVMKGQNVEIYPKNKLKIGNISFDFYVGV